MLLYSVKADDLNNIPWNEELSNEYKAQFKTAVQKNKEIAKKRDLTSREKHEIYSLAQNFKTLLMLEKMGLKQAVVQVHEAPSTHPRAYVSYPTIYSAYSGYGIKETDVLIDVPSGYNNVGSDLLPSIPHKLISESKAKKIRTGIDMGGYGPARAVHFLPRSGSDLPEDYYWNNTVSGGFPWSANSIYVIDRKIASPVNDFLNAAHLRNDAAEKYTSAMREVIQENNKDVHVNSGYTLGKNNIDFKVRLSGEGGKTVTKGDFSDVVAKKKKNGEFSVTPDPKTEKGVSLQALKDEIPNRSRSQLSDIMFMEYGNSHVLAVFNERANVPKSLQALPQMSPKTYAWMQEDNNDASNGSIKILPTMPDMVTRELGSLGLDLIDYRVKIKKFDRLWIT